MEKFPENPMCKPFNGKLPKFLDKNQMEWKFWQEISKIFGVHSSTFGSISKKYCSVKM